ncbi:MAG: hypothetical protein WC879_03355 [Melioribacteraceae bacterium]
MEFIKYTTEVIAKFKDEDGTIYKIGLGTDSLTKTDSELKILAQQKFDEIKFREANPLPPTVQELRKKELDIVSPIDEMVIAIWERIVENRPEASNLIQQKREIVKLKIPKG